MLFLISYTRPVTKAAAAKPIRNPNVGFNRYAGPPPVAKIGSPQSPITRYVITLANARFDPRSRAASRTKKNCSVKCIGTGWTGIVILRKAPTAMRAVNSPPSVRSLISHRFINMLCPSKPSWLPVCRSIRRYQQAFPA